MWPILFLLFCDPSSYYYSSFEHWWCDPSSSYYSSLECYFLPSLITCTLYIAVALYCYICTLVGCQTSFCCTVLVLYNDNILGSNLKGAIQIKCIFICIIIIIIIIIIRKYSTTKRSLASNQSVNVAVKCNSNIQCTDDSTGYKIYKLVLLSIVLTRCTVCTEL